MKKYTLGELERKFADLIWNREPINSGDLVELAEGELQWKKSTTYTVLRRLCAKEIFINKDSTVTSLISKEEYIKTQSRFFVENVFDNSLPQFINAFIGQDKLSDDDINRLQALIDNARESNDE